MPGVRWGVLGCANFARKRTIPALLESPNVELVAVASRTIEKAREFRREFNIPRAYGSYQELLEDRDIHAVYIPLPNGLHGEWMIRAAEKGIHSLTEKPFTTDAGEARRVAEAARTHGVQVMEGFMWRLHRQHLRAREVIRSGKIGPVRLVRGAFTFQMERKPNVRFQPELAGGSLWDVGCYPVSAARFYLEDEPARVYARGDIDREFRVDMRVAGMLEFASGRALFDCGYDLPRRTDLEIVGERGVITIPQPWLPEPEAEIVVNGAVESFSAQNQYVEQFKHFSVSLLEGRSPDWGADDAVKQMQALDAVLRSIRSGRPEALA